MPKPALIFEHSPFFLVLCLVAGLVYAYLLYQKKGPWSKRVNIILFALRFIAVTTLALLLVSPILKQIQNQIEKPTFVIAIDNSKSLAEVKDSLALKRLTDELEVISSALQKQDFDIEFRSLTGKEKNGEVQFNEQATDLNSLLNGIKTDYENRNLAGVLLVSDGIYNMGMSPGFANYNFDINTLAIGDTIPKSDVSISALFFNRLSYQGNKFPLVVQLQQKGYDGQKVMVSISDGSKIVAQEEVQLLANGQIKEVKFLIEAKKSGFQRYIANVSRKNGELTYQNNSKNAYVEVIEGKELIALIAASPHPDIKALRSAIESNANYQFEQYILSNSKDIERLEKSAKKFDLIIYHQLPAKRRIGLNYIQDFDKKGISSLTIFGSQSDLGLFNLNDLVKLAAVSGEFDNITAVFNQSFSSFKLSDELQASFDKFPPISVPFGRYNLTAEAQVMLYQRVGSITTNKPLIAIMEEGELKKGVLMGQGIWKWKLTDYANNGNNNRFNELVTKLVQYLSTREDKRKFRVYPVKNEFLNNESVVFETEIYNDLFENVYGNKVDLKLKNSDNTESNYSYVTSENNSQYVINELAEGVYRFQASTTINGKKESVNGEVLVKELQLESINLTADFTLLRKLSSQTGGRFYAESDMDKLKNELSQLKAQGIIHSNETDLPFINLQWIFISILLLISLEWFIRKYSGGY
jgi:hypothetical protein